MASSAGSGPLTPAGRRVIVTGARGGIGRATVELLESMVCAVAGCDVDDFDVVMPGLIATPKVLALPEPARNALSATLPLGRIGEPAELAGTVAFLLSPAAAYITGTVIRVDGGHGLNTATLARS